MFEGKKVKAIDSINYLQVHFPTELQDGANKLKEFDFLQYNRYIQSLNILSEVQKEWLCTIIPYRQNRILEWIEKEDDGHV